MNGSCVRPPMLRFFAILLLMLPLAHADFPIFTAAPEDMSLHANVAEGTFALSWEAPQVGPAPIAYRIYVDGLFATQTTETYYQGDLPDTVSIIAVTSVSSTSESLPTTVLVPTGAGNGIVYETQEDVRDLVPEEAWSIPEHLLPFQIDISQFYPHCRILHDGQPHPECLCPFPV